MVVPSRRSESQMPLTRSCYVEKVLRYAPRIHPLVATDVEDGCCNLPSKRSEEGAACRLHTECSAAAVCRGYGIDVESCCPQVRSKDSLQWLTPQTL